MLDSGIGLDFEPGDFLITIIGFAGGPVKSGYGCLDAVYSSDADLDLFAATVDLAVFRINFYAFVEAVFRFLEDNDVRLLFEGKSKQLSKLTAEGVAFVSFHQLSSFYLLAIKSVQSLRSILPSGVILKKLIYEVPL